MGVNAKKVVEYRGGGWYKLPDGEKVRGHSVALAMAEQQVAQETEQQFVTLSDLAGRMRFLKQAGLQYKGVRDVFTTAGYIQEGAETFENYWARYERDPVAGRIVDMPAKTTWRTPPEVFEGEAEEDLQTEFERAWAELVKGMRVWKHFENVDRLSRVGRYAALFIGFRGGDDSDLKNPVEQMTGVGDILYLSSYSEKYATIEKWDQDPLSKRFGLPEVYKINLSSGVDKFTAKTAMVHHSRVIHVAEDTLTDDVYGRPALKRALNALDDLLKVTASTGEAYWQLATRILTGKIDPMAELGAGDIDKMGEKLEEMVHDLRRQFVGHGVELDWLRSETPKPGDALEVYKQLMAVASGIPTRILFGSEQGQLASSQDERSYFGTINERQEHHAEPNILRAFIDRLLEVKALPKVGAEGYNVVWPSLFEMSEKDIAEANKARAETAKSLTPMGGDPLDIIEVDEQRNVWLLPTEEIEKRREAQARLAAQEARETNVEEPPDVDLGEEGEELEDE